MANTRLIVVSLWTALLAAGISLGVEASDPTKPYGWQPQKGRVAGAAEQTELVLTQIIAFDNHRYAIINGQRYQQFDQVDGFRIITIGNQRVRLQKGQQELQLLLFGEPIKKRSGQQGEIE